MSQVIDKVTAFITRPSPTDPELLLFQHPYAGIQVPAGTVENGETPAQAALREAAEETGLALPDLSIRRCLGYEEEHLPEGQRVIAVTTTVCARPDVASFDWARLRRGIQVALLRQADGFSQVTYVEHDREPDPQYVTYCITGWVPDDALTDTRRRHFFHLEFHGQSEDRWTVYTDQHCFDPFWAPLADLPAIISPQDRWLRFLDAL